MGQFGKFAFPDRIFLVRELAETPRTGQGPISYVVHRISKLEQDQAKIRQDWESAGRTSSGTLESCGGDDPVKEGQASD